MIRKRRTVGGSLTVFLALILTGVFAITGVCLEYARAQVLSAQIESATAAAAESIFAGYHAPLWAEYELFSRMTSGGKQTLEEETMRYADAWGGRRNRHGSLASFRTDEAKWSDTTMLTGRGGEIFRRMAVQSMKASAGEILSGKLKEYLGLSGSGNTSGTLRQNAGKEQISGKNVLSSYQDVHEAVQAAEKKEEETASEKTEKTSAGGSSEGSVSPGSSHVSEEKSALGEEDAQDASSAERIRQEKERENGRKYLSLIDQVRNFLDKGILALVLPEGKHIPEGTVPGGVSLSGSGGGGNPVLFREYLMRHMSSYLSGAGHSPSCEIEYLIAGKASDRSNLASCAARVFWIRMGLNLTSLLASETKQARTHEAAALAVGWTGQPWLIEAVNILLLSVWAAVESLSDVRQLLAGGSVVLIKTEADWKTDLDHAAAEWNISAKKDDGERGLSYEDYLRICLYFQSDRALSQRGLSVIQWNMQKIDSDFQAAACMVEGTLTIRAHSREIFAPLDGMIGKNRGSIWEKRSHFSYLKAG